MKQVMLADTGRKTSQLGFGCSFPGDYDERKVGRVLAAAYDAGIRHFDVAPYYLDGRAESYLGTFLSGRKDATVTTKYGLRPQSRQPFHLKAARAVLGPVVRTLRGRKSNSGGAASPATFGHVPKAAKSPFTPDDIRRSLSHSLSALRTETVDLYLLHEAEAADLAREGVIGAMQAHLTSGQVRALGVAGEVARVSQTVAAQPAFCRVAQFDWDAVHRGPRFDERFSINFRVFSRDPSGVVKGLSERFGNVQLASQAIDLDLLDQRAVRALLLRSAVLTNPNGITLISSSSPDHILENVRASSDASLDASSERLLKVQ